jgi:hypothetical protein
VLQLNLSTIRRAHRNFLHNHDRSFDFLLSESFLTQDIRKNIEANPVPIKRTRHLKNSSKARVFVTKNRTLVRVENNAKYAWAQDSGSGLHGPKAAKYPIRPKNPGGLLRFFWRRKGRWVALRGVMHPGVPATHFLEVATLTTFRVTGQRIRQAMDRAAKHF